MRGLILVFLIMVVGCAVEDRDERIPDAGPEDYGDVEYRLVFRMWEEFGGDWQDADKTGNGDSKMCWAAVAANLLVWGGWAEDADAVFGEFKSRFSDEPMYLYDALVYYLGSSGVAEFCVRESRPGKLMNFIVSALHEGRGVAVRVGDHLVSVWGYQYLGGEFSLFYTNSDDGGDFMRRTMLDVEYAVSIGKAWECNVN